MSKSDHDHSSFARLGYAGYARPYGISDDENREFEKGRLDRQKDEEDRYRANWGGKDKRG